MFECHEEVLYLQPLIPPKRFDVFSPIGGLFHRCALIFFFKFCKHSGLTFSFTVRTKKILHRYWTRLSEVYKNIMKCETLNFEPAVLMYVSVCFLQ